jgi:hypothetical protein
LAEVSNCRLNSFKLRAGFSQTVGFEFKFVMTKTIDARLNELILSSAFSNMTLDVI